MGLFSRRSKTVVPESVLGLLPDFGAAVLASRSGPPITDPRFDWDDFKGPVLMGLGLGDSAQRSLILDELVEAAAKAHDQNLATLGAYQLLVEFDPELTDERYLRLMDASLAFMESRGLGAFHFNSYENARLRQSRSRS